MFFSTANSRAGQLTNEGSFTFTLTSSPAGPVSTQCRSGPRQPSTSPNAYAWGGNGAADLADGLAGDVERHAAGDDRPPQQAVTTEPRIEAEEVLAEPPAVGVGEGVAGVVEDGAHVPHVVVEPLQLEERDPQQR